jgi:N-methylhydantoinase A
MQRAGEPGQVRLLGHGTTVATNALIMGRLARVVLVTTEGFRDVLAIRGGRRPSVYDLDPVKPRDLVARRDRVEVAERIGPRGEVLRLPPGTIVRVETAGGGGSGDLADGLIPMREES